MGKNSCKTYTVKIPRQVTHQVPRTVQYTDYETRSKQVPYTVNRSEQRTRMETQKYTVPITTTNTRLVPVTKKVPKTIYVDVTTQVPQNYTSTTMQTRERQVPVPYFVNIPETKYRTVTEQVPVQRTKIQMDTINKMVYDTQTRTRCLPETKLVTKQIPVYNAIPKPAPPCPPDTDCSGNATEEAKEGDYKVSGEAINRVDASKDGQISFQEYTAGRSATNLPQSAQPGPTYRE